MANEINYLVESPEIEKAFLAGFKDHLSNLRDLLFSFGVNPMYSWYLIEMPMDQLVSSFVGDVDILAGNLQPNSIEEFETFLNKFEELSPDAHPSRHDRYVALELARTGGLMWPPSMDYLVGIEVKCSHLPATASEIS